MPPVNLISPEGKVVSVPEEDAAYFVEREGYRPESQAEGIAATAAAKRTERFQGTAGAIAAGGLGLIRSVTGGLSDVGARALGVEQDVADIGEAHPTASLVGEVGGYFTPGVGGAIGKLGNRISKGAEGAGALAQVGRAGAAGAVEGALAGAQQGISEVALSDDPLTIERAASVMASDTLFGGGIGGVTGALGKSADLGLGRAKRALERRVSLSQRAGEVGDDLARLDAKGLNKLERETMAELRTARASDKTRLADEIKASRGAEAAEIEAIKATRVTERATLADDIAAHRKQMLADKTLLVSKDATDREIRSLAARSAKADAAMRNLLDNPKAFTQKPEAALAALQRQESAIEGLIAKTDDLRASFAADKTMARQAALDTLPAALERNRLLQQRIASVTGDLDSAGLRAIREGREAAQMRMSTDFSGELTNARLQEIRAAKDVLAEGGGESIAQKMLGGTLFGVGAGAVASTGMPGSQYIAPLAGAGLAGIVSKRMGGKLSTALRDVEARGAKALGAVLNMTARVQSAAPVLATKVLGAVRYSDEDDGKKPRGLTALYKKRSDEVLSQMTTGPDGKPAMRPAARAKVASQLAAVAAHDPILADRIETHANAKLVFLASKMPREPELAGMQMGPSRWQPSEMDMRKWARYAAAAEDPIGVLERASAGTVTPEDAETMRELFPQLLSDFKAKIAEQAATLRKSLPFNRRLALTILTGVAVDPALDPRILSVLQSQHTFEEGADGGTMAPRATSQFGSVRSQDKATPAQARAGGQGA